MPKLKLGPITGEKPVRITTELPAGVHRDLLAYADALARETGQTVEPTHVIAPMLARFMATDRHSRSSEGPCSRRRRRFQTGCPAFSRLCPNNEEASECGIVVLTGPDKAEGDFFVIEGPKHDTGVVHP